MLVGSVEFGRIINNVSRILNTQYLKQLKDQSRPQYLEQLKKVSLDHNRRRKKR